MVQFTEYGDKKWSSSSGSSDCKDIEHIPDYRQAFFPVKYNQNLDLTYATILQIVVSVTALEVKTYLHIIDHDRLIILTLSLFLLLIARLPSYDKYKYWLLTLGSELVMSTFLLQTSPALHKYFRGINIAHATVNSCYLKYFCFLISLQTKQYKQLKK